MAIPMLYTGRPEGASDATAEAFAQAIRRSPELRDPLAWIWRAAFRIAAGEMHADRRLVALDTSTSYEMPDRAPRRWACISIERRNDCAKLWRPEMDDVREMLNVVDRVPAPDLSDDLWRWVSVPGEGFPWTSRCVARAAMAELMRVDAAGTVRSYNGCFNARFVNRSPGAMISHHAWGIAIDLNLAGNAFGQPPHQDPRLVEVMRREGFVWGGRFLVPDGMHFESG